MCRPEGVELTRPDLEQLGEREEDVDYNCPACVVGESDRTGLESGGDFWGDFWDDFFFWRFIPRKLQKIRALCDFFFFFFGDLLRFVYLFPTTRRDARLLVRAARVAPGPGDAEEPPQGHEAGDEGQHHGPDGGDAGEVLEQPRGEC